jgi:riboflavin synthase
MFTGIVTAIGHITRAHPSGDGVRLRIDAPAFGLDDVAIGDSVAIQGICHTVVARDAAGFEVDTSRATLGVTTGLEIHREVNLEKSLRLADRLGGHLVSGHVDGVAEVVAFEPLANEPSAEDKHSVRLVVEAPAELARYIARKGSVAIDGVSLTVNAVEGTRFEVNLIPHTLEVTTLRRLQRGARVNLEVDMIARYVERMV